MPSLRLTVRLKNLETGQEVVRWYSRSPVTVGRGDGNSLRLESTGVQQHHGAFVFAGPALWYVDFRSRSGTTIDGLPLHPERAVRVRESSTLTVGRFEITARVDVMETGDDVEVARPAADGDPFEPDGATLPDRPPQPEIWGLLIRALQIVEILACMIITFRRETIGTWSPLTASFDLNEIIAYLLDPAPSQEIVDDLLRVLTEMLDTPQRRSRPEAPS
jgi:hypothetical protein